MLCNRRDTGDFYIIWRCLFDRQDCKTGERYRKDCDGTCRSDQRTQPERNFSRISARTYRSRWNHINKAVALIKKAKELGMYTVLRYFLLDSMAFENIRQQQHMVRPDFIEVLPGVMPRVIKRICGSVKTPIIAGGLITDKEDVMAALSAGAIAVSSTNHQVWKM